MHDHIETTNKPTRQQKFQKDEEDFHAWTRSIPFDKAYNFCRQSTITPSQSAFRPVVKSTQHKAPLSSPENSCIIDGRTPKALIPKEPKYLKSSPEFGRPWIFHAKPEETSAWPPTARKRYEPLLASRTIAESQRTHSNLVNPLRLPSVSSWQRCAPALPRGRFISRIVRQRGVSRCLSPAPIHYQRRRGRSLSALFIGGGHWCSRPGCCGSTVSFNWAHLAAWRGASRGGDRIFLRLREAEGWRWKMDCKRFYFGILPSIPG